MNLRQLAEGAPYHLVTKMEECPLARFWVVLLSAGFEVYQTYENGDLKEPNPWMRLKQFCIDNNVIPMSMAFADKTLNPQKQINLDPTADAYFYSRRIRKLISGNPRYAGYQDSGQGVGELRENKLKIVWELDDGRWDVEERDILEHPKATNIALIYKK